MEVVNQIVYNSKVFYYKLDTFVNILVRLSPIRCLENLCSENYNEIINVLISFIVKRSIENFRYK